MAVRPGRYDPGAGLRVGRNHRDDKGDDMLDKIQGSTMPVLEIALDPGESVVSEVGEFGWMTDAIQLSTGTGGGMGGRGLMGALKRAVSGSTFLFNTYTAVGGQGLVAFPAKIPGSIFPVDVAPGREYLTHRHGFLAGIPGIEISPALQQSFKGGIFGGEGFILQRLAGTGRAWVELSGHVTEYDLQPGQVMRVHPGHVGLFDASVSFQVQRVPGVANRYLGSDGHHFVLLSGPGRVWLQSMPVAILAGALQPYLSTQDTRSAVDGGLAAGALGDLFGR
jgi:uncharacterized protein (AIM24 family)